MVGRTVAPVATCGPSALSVPGPAARGGASQQGSLTAWGRQVSMKVIRASRIKCDVVKESLNLFYSVNQTIESPFNFDSSTEHATSVEILKWGWFKWTRISIPLIIDSSQMSGEADACIMLWHEVKPV